MNKNTIRIYSISWIALIFFTLSAGLCPLTGLAKTKRHQPRQQTVKEEKKEKAEEAEEKTEAAQGDQTQNEGAKPGESVKGNEAAKEDTAGLPTKDYKEDDFKPQVEEESPVWMFIKMIILLGIFAGGFYYFYRFVTKKAGISIFGGEAVRVLSVVPVGQNKFLQLVDVAGKVILVGVSDSAINLIMEITEKDQIDRIRILSTRTPPPNITAGGFQDHVVKEIGKIIGRVRDFKKRDRHEKRSEEYNPADIEYLRQQRNRLKDLNGQD